MLCLNLIRQIQHSAHHGGFQIDMGDLMLLDRSQKNL